MPTGRECVKRPAQRRRGKMQKRSECPNGLRARRNAAKSAVRSAPLLRAPDRRAQIPLSLLRLCESPLQRSEGRAMRARLPGKRGSPSRSREGDPTCAYICFFEPLARAAQTERAAYFAASLAFSARAAKAAGSEMASSERTLRLMSTPATFRPLIMRE